MSVEVGDAVMFVPQGGAPQAALVTKVDDAPGTASQPRLGLAYLSLEEDAGDGHGRRILRGDRVEHHTVPGVRHSWCHIEEVALVASKQENLAGRKDAPAGDLNKDPRGI